MPAEWAPHRGTWLSWPHKEASWPGKFGPVPGTFATLVRTLADRETVHINVAGTDGKDTEWMVEGGTPNTLLRAGIDRNTLKAGQEIIVRGYQSKDRLCRPACKANGRDVTFPDGRKLFMGSSGTGAPKDGADAAEK